MGGRFVKIFSSSSSRVNLRRMGAGSRAILPEIPRSKPWVMTARGFTLIELSIVLVIIGLVVGGILVGQGLINAAALRAQITQIEKYNTAANTFREKYGYLPGDITATAAAQFGFAARGSLPGQGDGNGLLEGSNNNSGADGRVTSAGETVMFWADLGAANLIDQTFTTPSATASANCANAPMSACFPTAKISSTNYVYAWSGGYFSSTWMSTGVNYFGISSATSLAGEWGHGFHSNADGPTGLCARQQNG